MFGAGNQMKAVTIRDPRNCTARALRCAQRIKRGCNPLVLRATLIAVGETLQEARSQVIRGRCAAGGSTSGPMSRTGKTAQTVTMTLSFQSNSNG